VHGRFASFRCFYHPTRALLWQVVRTYNESRIDQATRVGLSAECMAVSNRALIGEPKGRQGCSRIQGGARAVVDLCKAMRFSRSCLFIRFYHLGMLLTRVLGCGGKDVPGHSDWSDDAALASACKALGTDNASRGSPTRRHLLARSALSWRRLADAVDCTFLQQSVCILLLFLVSE